MRLQNLAPKILQGHSRAWGKKSVKNISYGQPAVVSHNISESPNQRITESANHPRARITMLGESSINANHANHANHDHDYLHQTRYVVQVSRIASLKTGVLRPLPYDRLHGIIRILNKAAFHVPQLPKLGGSQCTMQMGTKYF